MQWPGDAALEGKDPDALAQQNNYGALDPVDSLNRMANHRQKLLGILAGLSEAQWAQEGTHSEYGAMSVFDIAQFALGHDGYHLKQTIERVA